LIEKFKSRAWELKRELSALSVAMRDPRTPWHAKALIALVLAYALSPIDLIPDFIPVFGYLDDILIVPVGIALAMKMIPTDVINEARNSVMQNRAKSSLLGMLGMVVIILVWILAAAWIIWQLYRLLSTIKR
jgi:uncharacterized membrane protein YkvA (DUF1232 family)